MKFEEEGIDVSSLRFFGRAFHLSGFFRLIGTVAGVYSAPCARCLAPVRETFSVEIDFPIETVPTESEEETVLAEGQKIDLTEISQETVSIHLPMRLLCREDCKGLCPVCGTDLNDSQCGCATKQVDPRLVALSELLKNN
jgi:uncharacterized protein